MYLQGNIYFNFGDILVRQKRVYMPRFYDIIDLDYIWRIKSTMVISDLNIGRSFRSNENSMVRDFYNPILSVAKSYKRAVGYFTISSLINAAQGLSNLISNGGIVQIIASPKLNEEDINTINLGYKMKSDVVLDALIREFCDILSDNQKEKLNYIAKLIADNRLDIKIALMDDYGAYHEKFGLIEDLKGNKLMFTGSMNETGSGQNSNFESFVVFKSWIEEQRIFVSDYEKNFENLWNNRTNRLSVEPFPEVLKKKLLEFQKPYFKKEIFDEDDYIEDADIQPEKYPLVPNWFEPRPYQIEAINNWKKNNYSGLFSMATGTGKTLTGLFGMTELWKETKRLAIIIVCPYQHLVEQWSEDIKKFNIDPVKCYSNYHDWKSKLNRKIKFINNKTINNFTIVTTNASFVTDEMQMLLKRLECDILLLVDEVHNAGTETMKRCLVEKYKYRLGLSATPKRYRDEENTNYIVNYFGGEVYNFDLERAIKEKYLTKYFYYPHSLKLTFEEQEKYNELSLRIAQNIKEENGKVIINDFAKSLLIKRARIVAGANNKLVVLRKLMENYKNDKFILVYCGAAKTIDDEDDNEVRQIEKVCRILGNEYGMNISKFTAEENTEEREDIINMFSDGKSLQAIVAIKCLDEGVNIPAIQHAFILASSTDPKEFIQRRGRVLRLYEGKEFAYIHDFITLPFDQDKGANLVENELKRVYEFNSLAENKIENESVINSLLDDYNISIEKITDLTDKYNLGGSLDEE